jgi:nanoRNase/pAp phosphatase (c-di-AMP/oligoRNAs hydrolase)
MGAVGAAQRVARSAVERLVTVARDDPAVIAVVVVLSLAVAVALALLWQRYRRTAGELLVEALRERDEVSVLMHPNPDPDAMACALGVAALAEHADARAHIHYSGEIRHQENRAFRTVLDLDCDPVENREDLAEHVVLVDHNRPRGFDGAERVDPVAVVDHHPGEPPGSTTFADVREEYGACATIVAEYFEGLGAEPGAANGTTPKLDHALATGLLYGILADTNHLTRGCDPAEFAASRYLFEGVDEDLLDRVANPQVDAEVLDVRARAIHSREVRGPYAISDVGEVSNVDAIPQAADELLQLEGISTVVVFGDRNGTLRLSGRSHDDRIHMGETLDRAICDLPAASAGGHARMGGGQLSFENAWIPRAAFSRGGFRERLFDALSGER